MLQLTQCAGITTSHRSIESGHSLFDIKCECAISGTEGFPPMLNLYIITSHNYLSILTLA